MKNNAIIIGDSYSTFKGFITDEIDTVFVFGGTNKETIEHIHLKYFCQAIADTLKTNLT